MLSGGSAVKSGAAITAGATNESGVLVKNSGSLTLRNVAVSTTGKSPSSDDSSFYGLDAGVLAFSKGTITETGGSVTTTGDGANGVLGSNSITVTGSSLTGSVNRGVMI